MYGADLDFAPLIFIRTYTKSNNSITYKCKYVFVYVCLYNVCEFVHA